MINLDQFRIPVDCHILSLCQVLLSYNYFILLCAMHINNIQDWSGGR